MRIWIDIGDTMINSDMIVTIKRKDNGASFTMINGSQLDAEGASFDQIRGLLGFQIDGEKAEGEN